MYRTLGGWGRRREEIKKKTNQPHQPNKTTPNHTNHLTKPTIKTNQPLMRVEGNKKRTRMSWRRRVELGEKKRRMAEKARVDKKRDEYE